MMTLPRTFKDGTRVLQPKKAVNLAARHTGRYGKWACVALGFNHAYASDSFHGVVLHTYPVPDHEQGLYRASSLQRVNKGKAPPLLESIPLHPEKRVNLPMWWIRRYVNPTLAVLNKNSTASLEIRGTHACMHLTEGSGKMLSKVVCLEVPDGVATLDSHFRCRFNIEYLHRIVETLDFHDASEVELQREDSEDAPLLIEGPRGYALIMPMRV